MLKISNYFKKILFILSLLILLLAYFYYHIGNINKNELRLFNNMIKCLEKNDIKSSKFYLKKIINGNSCSIYYDMSCLFLYNLAVEDGNILKMMMLKRKIIKNKKSIFKYVIENSENENKS